MKIESDSDVAEKRRWKIVRTDTYQDVPGEIVSADEMTGECCVEITAAGKSETKTLSFGPRGIRLARRRR
jgi:hypothetical protein